MICVAAKLVRNEMQNKVVIICNHFSQNYKRKIIINSYNKCRKYANARSFFRHIYITKLAFFYAKCGHLTLIVSLFLQIPGYTLRNRRVATCTHRNQNVPNLPDC